MKFKIMLCTSVSFCFLSSIVSQSLIVDSNKNSNIVTGNIAIKPDEKEYNVGNNKTFIYPKPKAFSFLTNLPKDAAGITSAPFRKKNLKSLLFVAGSTALLLFVDQPVADGVRQFSSNIHLHPQEDYKNILSIKLGKKDVSLVKVPNNINTAIYQLGQGFPSLLIGAGLFTYGKIHKDYRAVSTASQLAESFILMGVATQVLKRITGRQSPSAATSSGGTWHFFPSFKQYQNHTTNYDAFPSGHLATLMSTVTILAENYPEKKWIIPVGYTVIGLVGFSMINNNVHWVSDYPLAIALGYLCAKQVVKTNRKAMQSSLVNRRKATLSYTFSYAYGRLMSGLTLSVCPLQLNVFKKLKNNAAKFIDVELPL